MEIAMQSRLLRSSFFAALAAVTVLALPLRAAAEDVTVFAAASLGTALDRIAAEWTAETGNTTTISYAGSSALARQIEQGAPADIFISASADWMDALETGGEIRPETRRDLLGNTLVLIAHGTGAAPVEIGPDLDLSALLGDGRMAMALVDSVPAGVYGKAALTALGLWDSVEAKVAQGDNVRAALTLVEQGEAPFGIVYATDAAASENVTVIGTFPAETHAPIVYPAAVTAQSQSPVAKEFLGYLGTPGARAIWLDEGFTVFD
jgi:molybdate transport system substrate-binding protein